MPHLLNTNGRSASLAEQAKISAAITNQSRRETVRESIHQNAAFSRPFVIMNTLATIVACYGLLSNSTAVVIGAMIIAMLLGPISGIALALVDGDSLLLLKAVSAEVGGALLVLLVAFVIGTLHQDIPLTREILARTRPNLLDLMIALAGGAAGAYANVSPRVSVGLVGVAIATALVPPLAACGICLARHEPQLAWGGFLLFFTNLVAIQFASSAVMWLSGFHAVTSFNTDDSKKRKRLLIVINSVSFLVLSLLTAVMGTNFFQSLRQQQFENKVRERLERDLSAYPGVHLADVRFPQGKDSQAVLAVVRTPFSFSPERVRKLEENLPRAHGKTVALEIMSVIVKETTHDGYLNEPSMPVPPSAEGQDGTTEIGEAASKAGQSDDATVFGP